MIFTYASSENTRPYQTLPFEWGPETQGRAYTIITEAGQIKIRRSLNETLQQLRVEKNPLVLWIDAICIN